MPARPAHPELDRILHPLSADEFFRQWWDRKPLHLPGAADKFQEVYDARTWRALRGVQEVKAATAHAGGWQVEIAVDPRQIDALYLAGMTVCADVSNDPKLAPFLRGFRRAFPLPGGAAFAKLYVSNDGKGFAPHADKFHVFVLQLEGSKRWRVSKAPVVPAPAQGMRIGPDGGLIWDDGAAVAADDGSKAAAPRGAEMKTVLLEPGHCLYLPPGTWHTAEAVGHSVAVSLSPPRTTQVELFARLLDILLTKEHWRRDLIAAPDEAPPPGRLPPSVADTLDARLAEVRALLGEMDPRTVHRFWRLNVAVGDATQTPPPEPTEVKLSRSDQLVCRGEEPLHFIVAPRTAGGEDGIFCYFGPHEWTFPIAAQKFLTELSSRRTFDVESALSWDASLGFDEVSDLLTDLLEAGALELRRK